MEKGLLIFILLGGLVFIIWGLPLVIGRRKLICRDHQGTLMTFDDGPSEVTDQLLDVLRACHCQACFFLLGEEVVKRRGTLKRIQEEGHGIGLHGYSHKHPLKMTYWEQKKDLERAYQIFKQEGICPNYYRAPHGAYTWASLVFCKKHGLKIVHWTGLVGDWELEEEKTLLDRLVKLSGPGHVLVLHDGTKGKANPLSKFLVPQLVEDLYRELAASPAPLEGWKGL